MIKLDPVLRNKAVKFLQEHVKKYKDNVILKERINKDPENWWAIPYGGSPEIGYPGTSFHFSSGMSVRNVLRQNGFGEKEFKIDNLDDIYISLIEDSINLTT